VHQDADNACIYTHHCLQIIDDYENDPAVPSESEFGGKEYRSDQWRDAVQAWAYEVAAAVIGSKVHDLINEISDKADALRDALDALDATAGADDADRDTIQTTTDCPHGWAAHDREDSEGIHYWVSRQVDGLNAIAIQAGPVWLSYTWDPAAAAAETEGA
jgi:hypothetical protein